MADKMMKMLNTVLKGGDLSPEDENVFFDWLLGADPQMLARVAQAILNQKRHAVARSEADREKVSQLAEELEDLRKPPFIPADVLRVYADGRIDVCSGQRRQIVLAVEGLDPATLEPGDEVLLNPESNMVVAKNAEATRAGMVATVSDKREGHIVVRGAAEEEIVVACAPSLIDSIEVGDRVVLSQESRCVVDRLAPTESTPHLLAELPRHTFDDIGGLDDILVDIRSHLGLFLEERAIAEQFGLPRSAGLLLAGGPGGGKTMVAGAVANQLAASGQETVFLSVKPGALRNSLYGRSEALISELFAYARRQPGLVVIFFDELESFGVRGNSMGHDIDGRVLATLLVELSGMEANDGIFVIGATNRLDLCDEALIRHQRFGDSIFLVPRPNREAARQILGKHLPAGIPYADAYDDQKCRQVRQMILESSVSYLFADNGHGRLATVVLNNAERIEVLPRDLVSGAFLAGVAKRACRAAASRRVLDAGSSGVSEEDVLWAIDTALAAETDKIRRPEAARRILEIDDADQIVRVEIAHVHEPAMHRFLTAA